MTLDCSDFHLTSLQWSVTPEGQDRRGIRNRGGQSRWEMGEEAIDKEHGGTPHLSAEGTPRAMMTGIETGSLDTWRRVECPDRVYYRSNSIQKTMTTPFHCIDLQDPEQTIEPFLPRRTIRDGSIRRFCSRMSRHDYWPNVRNKCQYMDTEQVSFIHIK